MTITITKLYSMLSEKLGKETAESVTSYIELKISKEIDQKTNNLASKQDVADAKIEMIKWCFGFFITLALMIIGIYLKL